MRTKEEIIERTVEMKIGTDGVQAGIMEALIDIRDILAEAFKEEIIVKEAEKVSNLIGGEGEVEETMKT